MKNSEIIDTVVKLVLPIVGEHRFDLIDVEYIKEQNNWYLRVYIDKFGGITIDDCQAVSEKLSESLDKMDLIKQRYILEVSSPGIKRPLKTDKDFERYKGESVKVKLFTPINGKKILSGQLMGMENDNIVIKEEDGTIFKIEKVKIALAKRIVKF